MSANTAEIAGNYALSGGTGDAEFVAERLAEMQADATERKRETFDDEVMQAEAETRDVDHGTIDVVGESITIEKPLGTGRRARIAKNATTADERGDDLAQLDAVLSMIDALDDTTPDEFDQAFWDDLGDDALRKAFGQLARQSAGGAQAGN